MALPEAVGESDFLRGLPQRCLERVCEQISVRRYDPGATLFEEGSRHDELHIVASGHVRLDMRVPGKGRIPILTAGPGDVLAWSAVIGNQVMTSSATALERVETAAIPGAELRELCGADHELGYHVMRQLAAALSRRLVATRLQLLDLFEGHVPFLPGSDIRGRQLDPEC
ncbi:cyclic nucleotide-binding domain-containing protein [Planctellipticum variicoloris]|uniref:cyclic nucleotide-binding domain-containing protein n=1 Tax=Planctellipticum variicoloris TaxID=3064265 RepID=UPI0030136CDC|nr:cyclic nucleotide-binding domain-containing protein [Planctomycetaceae bacterium SH412]